MPHHFLYLCHVVLEVLITFEFGLNGHYVLCIANLPVMNSLEVLLELIKLGSQLFTLGLDASQLSLSIAIRMKGELTLHLLELSPL